MVFRLEQMDGAPFPVTPDDLPSRTACVTKNVMAFLRQHGFHHPAGHLIIQVAAGYRIEHAGRSVIYLTDNELDPPYEKATEVEEFVDFCQGADILIHDAQYLDSDMPHKHGWGHSLVHQVCALATAAHVKHLVLYTTTRIVRMTKWMPSRRWRVTGCTPALRVHSAPLPMKGSRCASKALRRPSGAVRARAPAEYDVFTTARHQSSPGEYCLSLLAPRR